MRKHLMIVAILASYAVVPIAIDFPAVRPAWLAVRIVGVPVSVWAGLALIVLYVALACAHPWLIPPTASDNEPADRA